MIPGIQMDSLIARKIWRSIVVNETETGESYMVGQADHAKVPIPKFSTNQEDAHKIVEYFQAKNWFFRVKHIPEKDMYQTCFYKEDNHQYQFSAADTLPMAICIAGLAVIDGSNIVG